MNLLNENVVATLDEGGIVVLDGKYLAMTPETLNQAVKDGLMMAIGDTDTEQATDKKANDSSICSMCGEDDVAGVVCSRLILETGYGSANDMERVTIPLCGECADLILPYAFRFLRIGWKQSSTRKQRPIGTVNRICSLRP